MMAESGLTPLTRSLSCLPALLGEAIVGDLGLVGEVVVTTLLATACTVTFGIIIKETPKTVTVAKLHSRLVSGDSQDGLVRSQAAKSRGIDGAANHTV